MKVKDLPLAIVDQIVELEIKHILPILQSVGVDFPPEAFREQLKQFPDCDVVLSLMTDQRLMGFLIYETRKDSIMIFTFNLVKKLDLPILKDLLGQVASKLSSESSQISKIQSRAHLTNKRSVNFHRRMGFQEISRNEFHIEFEIATAELLKSIEQRFN